MNQTPTIGRRVYYWPNPAEVCIGPHRPGADELMLVDVEQPCDAGIVFVHDSGRVNLIVTDHVGRSIARELVHFGFKREAGGLPSADWMPYQKGASHTAATEDTREPAPRTASAFPYPRFALAERD